MTDKSSMTARDFGYQCAKGATDYLAIAGFGVVCFMIAVSLALNAWSPRDATDSPTRRSNMALLTDYGTGCQYLKTSDGAVTPRMGRDGKQICK